MPLLIVLNLSGAQVEVAPGQSLLAALQGVGIDWMHACGAKGRCTTCRIELAAGLDNLAPLTAAEERYRAAGRMSA
ncbi:2Fe-2S iron-sulfur cluster-binding protein [uncultured Hymenobacter sp.]|uniref:2Fe-2S iron-sulfur cluster-binding protein n=1 Tax=uncultured Hymenobacter sp. TaxID=170016 RepID=UPI0035CC05EE